MNAPARLIRIWVPVVAACLLISRPTAAILIENDFAMIGDGLLTLDDTAGLLWLDVGLTNDLSYNDVVLGIGNTWYAEGWRHATTGEMCSLFRGHVVAMPNCGAPFDQVEYGFGIADHLLSFMGR